MRVSKVRITLDPEQAKMAGARRLAEPTDDAVTTLEEANKYSGPEFVEGPGCEDLHVIYRDGMAKVNFLDDTGYRVNYDYPLQSIRRCHYIAAVIH